MKGGTGERTAEYLVDELPLVGVGLGQHVEPQVGVAAPHEVSRLRLEQRVVVAHGDELAVALPALVRHARQVRVALLAVAPHHARIVPAPHNVYTALSLLSDDTLLRMYVPIEYNS